MNGSTFVVEAALSARYQNGRPYQYREGDDIGKCFVPLFDRSFYSVYVEWYSVHCLQWR